MSDVDPLVPPGRGAAAVLTRLGSPAAGADDPPPPRDPADTRPAPAPATGLAEACRRFGLDPSSPLESRIRPPTPAVLQFIHVFRRQVPGPLRGPTPTEHRLTDAERCQLRAAVAILPLHLRQVLGERLRGFCFVDDMVVGGTVVRVNAEEPDQNRVYDIAINANMFHRTASDWLTHKEQSVFAPGRSALEVRIDVGPSLDALAYVLLHEAAHLVDDVDDFTYPTAPLRNWSRTPAKDRIALLLAPPAPAVPFLAGVWTGRWELTEPYRSPGLARVEFYAPGRQVAADEMPATYEALASTPLASLYSARNPMEDLAEYIALWHLTEHLKQPYRIVLHVEGIEVVVVEPMKSALVRRRAATVRRFFE